MRLHPIGIAEKTGRLRTRGWKLCQLAALFVVVQACQPGVHAGVAQTGAQIAANPTQSASAHVPDSPPAPQASASDEQKKQIAAETANLLNLANSLKAEVDKTTKDTLSVTVVREAGEIERLAHKMRTK